MVAACRTTLLYAKLHSCRPSDHELRLGSLRRFLRCCRHMVLCLGQETLSRTSGSRHDRGILSQYDICEVSGIYSASFVAK